MSRNAFPAAAPPARRPRRALRAALALAALLSSARAADSRPSLPAEPSDDRAAAIKAAFVLNFARYASWPDDRFARPDSPIVARVLGDPRVADALAELAERAGEVSGRRLVVARDTNGRVGSWRDQFAGLETAHLVYIGRETPAEDVAALVEELAGAGVLTVGDVDGFAREGGMLGLVVEDNRIQFDANVAALTESRVGMSARVLKLARRVEQERRP